MAGNTISLYLKEQGHEILGFAKSKSAYFDNIIGDAFDTKLLKQVISEYKFDAIINCIGMLNQFAEQNKAAATFLNSYLPHLLVEATTNMDTQVIHMSTDCVFSGKTGFYTESDFRDGETFYDRSKALGEINDHKNLTLRNSIVGPDINVNGIGLFNWFMAQEVQINGYTKSMWTGQTTLQLAKTIEAAASVKATGLINAVPEKSISKFELIKLFNHYFKNDTLIVNPIEGVCADKSLKRTNFNFDYVIPDYETMIAELAVWVSEHKKIYPHYNLINY